jgi:hypothetical protein
MKLLFNEKELSTIPLSFRYLYEEAYFTEKQILKRFNSKFYQNPQKNKIRVSRKPISKFYDSNDVR